MQTQRNHIYQRVIKANERCNEYSTPIESSPNFYFQHFDTYGSFIVRLIKSDLKYSSSSISGSSRPVVNPVVFCSAAHVSLNNVF